MEYSIGDIVTYQPFGGGTRRVKVTAKDINKGRPCFDGQLVDEAGRTIPAGTVWGYDYQILMVKRMAVAS